MCKLSQQFAAIDEPYAAGFFEYPKRGRSYRFAHAQRKYWEEVPLPAYHGGMLYPSGPKCLKSYGVRPDFSSTFFVDTDLLEQKHAPGISELTREAALLPDLSRQTVHTVGGAGYTHSIPHYGRIAKEGLDSYQIRILNLDPGDFRDGLLEILEGIKIYRQRCIDFLLHSGAPRKLIDALGHVPFRPAENLYEALVCWNFIYYIDGCDNPGKLDTDLISFYRGENAEALFREFFENVDQNDGWSCALGPAYNDLTLQCLRAAKGMRRPSIELRVTKDMPDTIWQAAIDSLQTGCGQPAFYCEEGYQSSLARRFPQIPKKDLLRFNGGGCTETMLAGLCNVGSIEAGIHLLLIFSNYMRSHLKDCKQFSDFYNGLLQQIFQETAAVFKLVDHYKRERAKFRPNPVRSLLIDDCIDRGLDFNAGGARYSWSVINLAGLVNVIDSLLAIRELIYRQQKYTADDFISLLDTQDPAFLLQLRQCPCFGRDDPQADQLAHDFTSQLFEQFEHAEPPAFGMGYLPASIQFATYAGAGIGIPATPDGRKANAPAADCIGAVLGKDSCGPTAMMNSAAKLNPERMTGTPVLNIRVQKSFLKKALKPLVQGYFKQGGMQVQISCISSDEIRAAMARPEEHQNLIVRIGGYSEYFTRLSPELQQTVLERTEFGA